MMDLESPNHECATFLIDNSTSEFLGHTWEYSKIFYNFFSVMGGGEFYLFSPLAGKEDLSTSINRVKVETMEEAIALIYRTIVQSKKTIFHIFILWAHQYEIEDHRSLASFKPPMGKRAIIQILGKFPTAIGRDTTLQSVAFEAMLAETYLGSACQVKFLAWDPLASGNLRGIQLLPITEHFDYFATRQDLDEKDKVRENFQVGFFGNLTSARGVGTFLTLALVNPDVKFKIRGSGFIDRSLYRPDGYVSKAGTPFRWLLGLSVSLVLTKLKKLPNIDCQENHHYASHVDLERDLDKTEFIFYSARNSGLSSGIVNMALHYGKRTLYIRGNSPASDLLEDKFPMGMLRWWEFIPLNLTRKLKRLTQVPRPVKLQTRQDFYRDLENLCLEHLPLLKTGEKTNKSR